MALQKFIKQIKSIKLLNWLYQQLHTGCLKQLTTKCGNQRHKGGMLMTQNQLGYWNLQETIRSHQANEFIGQQGVDVQKLNYQENVRHNKVGESIGFGQLNQTAIRNRNDYDLGLRNADIGWANVGINQQNANANWENAISNRKNAVANTLNATSQDLYRSWTKGNYLSDKLWGLAGSVGDYVPLVTAFI